MLEKRLLSFRYAIQGIYTFLRSQPNAQIHCCIMFCVIGVGIYVQLAVLEWCVVSLAISSVLAAEAFNTAIEYLTDLVSPEYHPLAGKVKDIAAGAVLLTAIGAAVVGAIIFLPKLLAFFFE